MTTSTSTSVLDNVVMVYPQIRIWCGEVQVNREKDLTAVSNQLPPRQIMSDGELFLVSKTIINPLYSVRRHVESKLDSHGVRFLGGWLVATTKVDVALREIESEQARFEVEVEALCSELPTAYAKQEGDYPTWSHLMRKHQISPDEVRRRCIFRVASYRLAEPTSPLASQSFGNAQDEVVHALLASIARRAKDCQRSLLGRDSIGQRLLNPIREIVAKLRSFSFVDARVFPSVQAFENALQQLPKHGFLSQAETVLAGGLLAQLADPLTILQHGGAAYTQQSHGHALNAPAANVQTIPEASTSDAESLAADEEAEEEPFVAPAAATPPMVVPARAPAPSSWRPQLF